MHPLIVKNRQAVRRLAAKHGVTHVSVFGSFARGQESLESDVDFLIKVSTETSPWFPGGLIADLEELLGRRVDVVEDKVLNPLIRDQVLAEAMPL